MLYVVTGGSGSGKSEFAENLAVDIFSNNRKGQREGLENAAGECCKDTVGAKLYYFATMSARDEESKKRIRRHRIQRDGKGFTTVECPVELERQAAGKEDVILLEDLSNLLANEMYFEAGRIKARDKDNSVEQLEQAVLFPLLQLEKKAACVIIVTNEVFSDGAEYDEETNCYLRCLGNLNQRLSEHADGVVEVVCGIPLWQKGKKIC